MDRSFLSQPEAIEASRNFVCVRLTTYENQAETEFMRNLYRGPNGEIQNTTFTILSPDGKQALIRPERSPRRHFRNAAALAS